MTALRKGWCPGALRPMQSGDGLVVRVRPRAGRLSLVQAVAIADAADAVGNGLIDLTRRASLQIRGVALERHGALIAALRRHDLIDGNADLEAVRNVVCDPRAGLAREFPETTALARELEACLARRPGLLALPGKFGFALDPAAAPILTEVPADIRIEGAAGGRMLVVPDGADHGVVATPDDVVGKSMMLAEWFSGQRLRREPSVTRMRHAVAVLGEQAVLVVLDGPIVARATAAAPLGPGACRVGEAPAAIVGVAFGSLHVNSLRALVERASRHGARELRVTPWRALLVPGLGTGFLAELADLDVVTCPDDPRLFVQACPGAPACASARVETRAVAARLARAVAPRTLHVSGCEKGCAHGGAADVTLVGRDGAFDIIRRGAVPDTPVRRGVAPGDIRAALHELIGAP